MKKIIISATVLASLSLASVAFAQSTVTGTLSSGGSSGTTATSSSLSGSVGGGNSLSGSVGGGNSLTGTVTSTSTSSGGGGGGGGGGGSIGNGPPAGGGGGGGGGAVIVCPNLSDPYVLPSGYEIVNGVCDPIGSVGGGGTGTGGGTGVTTPGIPNTGAGGNAETNDIVLALSGLLGAAAGIALLRKQYA